MRYSIKIILVIVFVFQSVNMFAQIDSSNKLTFSGYGEMYYSYDFANPENHEKEDFIYNHKRHNEFNANLLIVKANYSDVTTRGNIALMAGNYPQYNLRLEPTWAQFVYEANIGIKLSKSKNLWLDAGILPSHLGFESAITADCWTITRSIQAENSPYYETGIKLSYINDKGNLMLSLLGLNGWQHIQKPAYIQRPSFGFQFNYKPIKEITFNYSNFIGSDKPDSMNAIRTFHNIYCKYESKGKIELLAGFDIGTDKYNNSDYGFWYSPIFMARYSITQKMKLAFRGELYVDKNQIIILTNTDNGFQVSGLSTNFEYMIGKNVKTGIEGKMYNSKDRIFQNGENKNYSITTNLTIVM